MSTRTAIYAITGNEFSALSVGFCTLRHQTPWNATVRSEVAAAFTGWIQTDGVFAHVQRGLNELFGSNPDTYDLRPSLRAHPDLRLYHFAAAGYAPDVARAQQLDGIPNAEAILLPNAKTHHIALPAMTDGTLTRLLSETLGL